MESALEGLGLVNSIPRPLKKKKKRKQTLGAASVKCLGASLFVSSWGVTVKINTDLSHPRSLGSTGKLVLLGGYLLGTQKGKLSSHSQVFVFAAVASSMWDTT